MLTVGLAVGFAQLVQLKPVAGAHEYVVAPLAVIFCDEPEQMVTGFGVIDKTGCELTTTTCVVLLLPLPLPAVSVTV